MGLVIWDLYKICVRNRKNSLDRFDNLYIDKELEMLTGLLNDGDCCIMLMTIKLIMKKTLSQNCCVIFRRFCEFVCHSFGLF